MSGKKEFLKDAAVYGFGNGLKKFIGIFLLPFYSRALSPGEYGVLGTISTFVLLLSVVIGMGLDNSVAFYYYKPQSETTKGEILYALFVLRILSFIPVFILIFFSNEISLLLFDSVQYADVIIISLLLISVNLLMQEQSHIYRFLRQPWKYNVITIVKSLSNIIFGISFVVVLSMGVFGAKLSSLISSAIIVIFSFLFYTRKKYTFKINPLWIKKIFKFGTPFIWSAIAGWIFQSSDRFFLLHYSTLDSIGFYSIGATFSQPIMLINSAIQMSFGVLFFQSYHTEEDNYKPESKKKAKEYFDIYFGLALIIASLISIFSIEFVTIVATEKYLPGAVVIPLLAFSLISGQAFQIMGPGILIKEKNWHFTWVTITTASINIILNFILIPVLSYYGAALATFISYLFLWLIKFIVSQKYFYINYKIAKVLFNYMLIFFISMIFPFMQYFFGIELNIIYKILSFILVVALLIKIGYINIQSIFMLLQKLVYKSGQK